MKYGVDKKEGKKVAEKWVKDFLNSKEGLEFKKELERDFLNFLVFGTPYYFNVETLEDIISHSRLTREDIINRFKHQLTEEEQEQLFSNKPL